MKIKRSPLLLLFVFFIALNANASNEISVKQAVIPDFADTVEDLLPAVVNISTTQEITGKSDLNESILKSLPRGSVFDEFRDLLENQQPKKRKISSLGSGFIISEDGYIVTNNHVIEDADEIEINLHDGKKFKAKLVGSDSKTDLALLKIDAKDLKYVVLGDSDKARIGQWVIAVGNPFGLGGSVSVGIISARGRDINSGQVDDFIQTDAAINKGNSGGPLFNTKGEVVGVASAIFSPSGGNVGIGFATPSNTVAPIIKQLKEKGEVIRGWLGVTIQDVSKEMADSLGMKEPRGAFVVEVLEDEPAENAGILPTDVIVEFDGKEIKKMKDLPKLVAKTPVGKKVKVTVIRQGKEKTLKAKVKKLNEEAIKKRLESEDSKVEAEDHVLGLGLVKLDDKIKKEQNIDSNLDGLLVAEVKKDSKAEEVGIKVGDVILSANQQKLKSIKDLKEIVAKAKKSGHKQILIFGKRQNISFVITLGL